VPHEWSLQFLLRFGDITENYYTTNRMIKKVFYDIFPNLFTLYPHGVYSDVSENAKHCHRNKKRVAKSYSLFCETGEQNRCATGFIFLQGRDGKGNLCGFPYD